MPNDAKLGLVLGVGLVIALAVVFFQRDQAPAESGEMSASAVQPKPPGKSAAKPGKSSGQSPQKPVKAKPSSLPNEAGDSDDALETSATTSEDRPILNLIHPAAGSMLPNLQPVPPQ